MLVIFLLSEAIRPPSFFEFVTSPAYKELFDYSTGLWREGPDYLRNIFEDTCETTESVSTNKTRMTEREIDIADMQCWVFRMAQTRWHISPLECAALFKKYDILGYILECYDLVCTYSYYHVVDDAEAILAGHKAFYFFSPFESIFWYTESNCASTEALENCG